MESARGNMFSDFASKNILNASNEFLQSNTFIAKFVFLLLVVIIFIFLASLGVNLIGYLTQPSKTTYVVNGMIRGDANMTIQQDPSNTQSITIWRSNNQETGIEFSWSAWIFVSDVGVNASKGQHQHIFSKGGNGIANPMGIMQPNNAPGLYLDPKTNTLKVYMDIVGTITNPGPEIIEISNFPLNKWVHVLVRLENTLFDVYVNGVISGRKQLQYIPKQNYDNVYIGANGGFAGYLSNLVYYSYALDINAITNIVKAGPNTRANTNLTITNTDYISNAWYASKL